MRRCQAALAESRVAGDGLERASEHVVWQRYGVRCLPDAVAGLPGSTSTRGIVSPGRCSVNGTDVRRARLSRICEPDPSMNR